MTNSPLITFTDQNGKPAAFEAAAVTAIRSYGNDDKGRSLTAVSFRDGTMTTLREEPSDVIATVNAHRTERSLPANVRDTMLGLLRNFQGSTADGDALIAAAELAEYLIAIFASADTILPPVSK